MMRRQQHIASLTRPAELDAPPPTDEANERDGEAIEEFGELPGRPLRKRFGPLAYLLLAALVACGAFYGGARYGKSQATSTTSSVSFPASASRSSSSRSAGFSFGTTVLGTIKLITGKDFYVEESTGTVVKVDTGAGTTVTVSSAASVSQLHPGDTVTVLGTNKNGTVTATRVSDSGSSTSK